VAITDYQPQRTPEGTSPPLRLWLDTEHRRIALAIKQLVEDIAAAGGGVTDHGALTGLSDDDHPQYPLLASPETISGAWTFSDTVTLTDASVAALIGADNAELRFGAGGDDLAIYHNGTNNWIDGNTGGLVLNGVSSTVFIQTDGVNRVHVIPNGDTVLDDNAGTQQFSITTDGPTYRDQGGTERFVGIAFNPFKPSNVNASQDITRADVGRTINCATGSVTFTLQAESEAGWIVGDTIEFTAQTTGTVTIATEGSGIRIWRGDGNAIDTVTTLDLFRSGRILVQYIGSDLWDVVRGSEDTTEAYEPPLAWQDADLVITSNAAFQDTDLLIPLTAGIYKIEARLYLNVHATPDMEVQLTYTGTTTTFKSDVNIHNTSTSTAFMNYDASIPHVAGMTSTAPYVIWWTAFIEVSDSGNLKIQARQGTSSGTAVTFYKGSWLEVEQLS
jgi:hypothetical protein